MLRTVVVALLAFCALAARAEAAKPTCRSGETVYKQGGVRIFAHGSDDAWFACGRRSTRPRLLFSATGGSGRFEVIERAGSKVLFAGHASGEGGGDSASVGWFDVRTSRVRSGELAGGVDNEPLDAAVTDAGGVGVVIALEAQREVRVGYLAPGRKRLRSELVLATPGGRFARGSLAFGRGTLGWRNQDGTARDVPLSGEPVTCASGTTVAEHDGARVFEVFPRRKTDRGFQADVLAACAAGETVPRELAVADVYDQAHWAPARLTNPTGVFVAGATGIGLLSGGAVRFLQPKRVTWVHEVAVAPDGTIVLCGELEDAEDLIIRVDGDTGVELASFDAGAFAPGSLATADGRVTWRTTDGAAHVVPLRLP